MARNGVINWRSVCSSSGDISSSISSGVASARARRRWRVWQISGMAHRQQRAYQRLLFSVFMPLPCQQQRAFLADAYAGVTWRRIVARTAHASRIDISSLIINSNVSGIGIIKQQRQCAYQ